MTTRAAMHMQLIKHLCWASRLITFLQGTMATNVNTFVANLRNTLLHICTSCVDGIIPGIQYILQQTMFYSQMFQFLTLVTCGPG